MKIQFLPDGPMVNVTSMSMTVPPDQADGSITLTLEEGGTILVAFDKLQQAGPFTWAGEAYASIAIMDDAVWNQRVRAT